MNYREILEDMCWQFGSRTTLNGKYALTTGGLPELKNAFAELGWNNPHYIEEDDLDRWTARW